MDYILFSLKNLWCHKLRTALTLIGISIGIAAVVTIYSVGSGAKLEIKKELDKFGGNEMVTITSRYLKRPGESYAHWRYLSETDMIYIRENPLITSVSAMVSRGSKIAVSGYTGSANVMGVEPPYLEDLVNRKPVAGRMLRKIDVTTFSEVCLIGERALKTMGIDQTYLGKPLMLNKKPFILVGILQEEMQKSKLMDMGDEIDVFLPYTSAQKLFGIRKISFASCRRKELETPLAIFLRKLEMSLRARNSFRCLYEARALSEELKSINRVLDIFTLVIGSIGALSLIVGGIGVMNIMLVSITERTREIGVRIAVGATTVSLICQFLIETMTVCLLGGIMGITLGVILVTVISYLPRIPVTVSEGSIITGILFSLFTGLIFGIYPAYKASRLDPIECLRYE